MSMHPEFENILRRFQSHVWNSKCCRQVETTEWLYLVQLSDSVHLEHHFLKNLHSLTFLLAYWI